MPSIQKRVLNDEGRVERRRGESTLDKCLMVEGERRNEREEPEG